MGLCKESRFRSSSCADIAVVHWATLVLYRHQPDNVDTPTFLLNQWTICPLSGSGRNLHPSSFTSKHAVLLRTLQFKKPLDLTKNPMSLNIFIQGSELSWGEFNFWRWHNTGNRFWTQWNKIPAKVEKSTGKNRIMKGLKAWKVADNYRLPKQERK